MTTTKQAVGSTLPSANTVSAASTRSPRVLRRMLALDDFEDAARRTIPRPIFGYVSGGAETNASMRANRAVWDEMPGCPACATPSGCCATRSAATWRSSASPRSPTCAATA